MSQTIQWSQAKVMIKKYRKNNNALKVPVLNTDTGDYDDHILKGYRVDRTHIEKIFSNSEVDELFIMLAVREADIDEVDDDDQYFTPVIVGLVNNAIVTSTVVDFCDPCPTSCPSNMDTLLN